MKKEDLNTFYTVDTNTGAHVAKNLKKGDQIHVGINGQPTPRDAWKENRSR